MEGAEGGRSCRREEDVGGAAGSPKWAAGDKCCRRLKDIGGGWVGGGQCRGGGAAGGEGGNGCRWKVPKEGGGRGLVEAAGEK